jgi:FkbH-like protein
MEGALHHVAIIVPDEERVHELVDLLGLKLGRRQFVPQYEADCIFTTGAAGVIEFIIAKTGKLSKFNKGMGGLHHIAITVPDLDAAKVELAAKGIPMLEDKPVDAGPIRINFVAPAYTRGVIVEYVQPVEAADQAAVAAHIAALSGRAAEAASPAAGVASHTPNAADTGRKSEQQIFKEARTLRSAGKGEESAALLRDMLRRGWISPEAMEKAGRHIATHLKDTDAKALNVLVLGQCTTQWVSSCLTASAWAGGSALQTTDGQFDNVLQELMVAASTGKKYDAVVLLPWNQRLLATRSVDDEVAFWEQAWKIAGGQMSARIIQVGYDWTSPGPLGHHLSAKADGPVELVRRVNDRLRAALPASAFFVDLEQASGMMGRERFYDSRRYFWTKQPFSEPGAARLAEHVWSGIRSTITGPKKVLVLDLDNTLWGGVVGETGPMGVEIGDTAAGEAFRAFQLHAKDLASRGVLLCVSSKNNVDDAREPFEKNPALPLKLSDFAAFEANWEPKSVSIQRMAQTLSLGLDSFVFFDDNPTEREQVRQMLPEVTVVEVPEEPAQYVQALEAGQWFEALSITAEDRERTEQYRAEAQRRDAQSSFANMDDYLKSLTMTGDVRTIDEADLPRVVQLLGKTNQFNLTTRRHGLETVQEMLARPRSIGLTVRIADRFADYGLVAVLIGVEAPGRDVPTLQVDTWLMSCRVIARTVEEFCMQSLMSAAEALGYKRIEGQYIPTKKNALVAELYDRMGFTRVSESADTGVTYTATVAEAASGKTFVTRSA